MEFSTGVFLFGAAVLADAMNSIAGGDGFIAFPALIFTGVLPISANAKGFQKLLNDRRRCLM
ncbi:MAG: hypothetical protein ICV85_11610 [Tolypothrix sp. T3-bin4]|nr:hypothetical protein [Tolypothrix sp. T3-bin4]